MPNARVLACRPSPDYTLWVRFDDGLKGEFNLASLLDIGCFSLWRDVRVFMTARPDPETGAIVWRAAGVRLDADILYHDLAERGGQRAPAPSADPGFVRFMQRALQRRRRGA